MVNSPSTGSLIRPDSRTQLIEEKSTKPPGAARFYRKKKIESGHLNLFEDNDNLTISGLCQQLLVGGFVQSYVDFYHLTHRIDSEADQGMSQIQIPIDEIVFIRDNLVQAELSRRQGDTTNVYSAFIKLADYYVKSQDWKTGFFFHEKCLEVAQLTSDLRAEMFANHSLGTIHQLMTEPEKARAYHERHEIIAASMDVFEEVSKANVELYKVYFILAQKHEKQGELDEALDYYNKCLEASKKSWDRAAEGEANGKIGNLLLNKGDAQSSLPYLKQQSQIAADLGHAEGRCRACSALALALDSLGQPDRALSELQLVNTISEQAGDTFLQAQACRSLGTLFSKVGQLEDAVDTLQRHFNLLKAILYRSGADETEDVKNGQKVSSRDLDLARAYIGISKGNLLMGSYVMSLQLDLTALLDWKLNRTELPLMSGFDDKLNNLPVFGSIKPIPITSSKVKEELIDENKKEES